MTPTLRIASAPLAGVLLVLMAVVVIPSTTPTGLPVTIAYRSAYPPGVSCIEYRLVVVPIEADRNLYINTEPVTRANLRWQLEEIFKTRVERAAFVLGAPELSYGEVAEIVADVKTVVERVSLVTPLAMPTRAEPLVHLRRPPRSIWN